METIKNERSLGRPFLKAPLIIFGLGMSALLMGCGADTSSEAAQNMDPVITAESTGNGTRTITYSNEDGYFARILQHCDGPDLVEQTAFLKYGYGAAGNSMSRSVGHPACVDGTLTDQDFKIAG